MSAISLWRIEKSKFAREVRRGVGPLLYGGRWTSPGRPAIYCSSTLSLALLEVLAHVHAEEDAGEDRTLFELEIGADKLQHVGLHRMVAGWRSALNFGPCRSIGDRWLEEGRAVGLVVPSAIVPSESNVILNPVHPDFRKVAWERPKRFQVDPRLLRETAP